MVLLQLIKSPFSHLSFSATDKKKTMSCKEENFYSPTIYTSSPTEIDKDKQNYGYLYSFLFFFNIKKKHLELIHSNLSTFKYHKQKQGCKKQLSRLINRIDISFLTHSGKKHSPLHHVQLS